MLTGLRNLKDNITTAKHVFTEYSEEAGKSLEASKSKTLGIKIF